jgi:hypothetical protein
MRPSAQSRPERTADERRDDVDLVGRQPEDRGDLVAYRDDPLALVPERQPIALPPRDRRVRLHRVVLLARNAVNVVESNGRLSEGTFRITPHAVSRHR